MRAKAQARGVTLTLELSDEEAREFIDTCRALDSAQQVPDLGRAVLADIWRVVAAALDGDTGATQVSRGAT